MSLPKYLLLASFVWAAGIASANPTVAIFPSISPDPFGSNATFQLWSANALSALQSGGTTAGTAGTPTYYAQTSTFTSTDLIGTTFPSWKGHTNPPVPFDTQTGNGLAYGMVVQGNGSRFTSADITYNDDFYDTLSSTTLSTVGYGYRMIGINYGANGVLGGGDDTIYDASNPGSSSSLVDVIYFSGFVDQFLVTDPSTLASSIVAIDNAPINTTTATGDLNISGTHYQGTATPTVVPEPGTVPLAGLGALLIGFLARKRVKAE